MGMVADREQRHARLAARKESGQWNKASSKCITPDLRFPDMKAMEDAENNSFGGCRGQTLIHHDTDRRHGCRKHRRHRRR
jgi:hypothetical protein